MTTTVEDAVERAVDLVVLVWPEDELTVGVHPWMHARGHEARAQRLQDGLHAADVLLEHGAQAVEVRARAASLHLDDVQGQLVGPGDVAEVDLALVSAGHGAQQDIRHGTHRQRLGIDDHVLDLDAEGLEQAQRGSVAQIGVLRPRRSRRS